MLSSPRSATSAAQAWSEGFLARPSDVVAHEEEVIWQVTERGWLYMVRDPCRLAFGWARPVYLDHAKAEAAVRR